ncbi:polyprenol reductase-like [Musca domestica]|uniref:Polyprenal reductase n=1 Tax=Musca domestica TaxID=7370 RepID=A0A1I8MNZ6_MUSDO|nr:polyprenol reductase-like [Musca domestica]
MLLKFVEQYLKYNKINLVNSTFIGFTVIIVIFGSLIIVVEPILPDFIKQSFRYGKHKHNGPAIALVNRIEVPKSWFRHFYIFAFTWALLALYLIIKGIITHTAAPQSVIEFLDFVAGGSENRNILINSNSALVASVLMTLQCGRRFYETNFVQIFSKEGKINIPYYVVGYLHYFGVILALLLNTEGFVKGTLPSSFSLMKITLVQYVGICTFCFSWLQQYKSNMILVNLRKNPNTHKLETEKHLMPTGGFFNLVSSPHMLFEILMYVSMLSVVGKSFTWKLIVMWVSSNQLIIALLTHKWYKENFKNYPKQRKALIPFLV